MQAQQPSGPWGRKAACPRTSAETTAPHGCDPFFPQCAECRPTDNSHPKARGLIRSTRASNKGKHLGRSRLHVQHGPTRTLPSVDVMTMLESGFTSSPKVKASTEACQQLGWHNMCDDVKEGIAQCSLPKELVTPHMQGMQGGMQRKLRTAYCAVHAVLQSPGTAWRSPRLRS